MIKSCLVVVPHDPMLNADDVGLFWSKPLERAGIKAELFHFDKMASQIMVDANLIIHRYTKRQLFDVYGKVEKKLVQEVSKRKHDLVLFFSIKNARKELLQQLKKASPGSILINVYHDNPFSYPVNFASIPYYDFFFVKDDYVMRELDKLGLSNCRFSMHGFSKDFHRPYMPEEMIDQEKKRYTADISFIGSIYPQRQMILEQLRGHDVKLWGTNIWDSVDKDSWILKHHNNVLCDQEMKCKIVSCSKINMNTHNYQNDIDGSNSRTFEICAAGGFQLVDYKPVLERHFRMGKEIVTFRTAKELRELAQYYLEHEKERMAIAAAGHKRAIKDHSYDTRLAEILKVIGK